MRTTRRGKGDKSRALAALAPLAIKAKSMSTNYVIAHMYISDRLDECGRGKGTGGQREKKSVAAREETARETSRFFSFPAKRSSTFAMSKSSLTREIIEGRAEAADKGVEDDFLDGHVDELGELIGRHGRVSHCQ